MQLVGGLLFGRLRPPIIAPSRVYAGVSGDICHRRDVHSVLQHLAHKRPAEVMR